MVRAQDSRLDRIHQKIVKRYADVDHLDASNFKEIDSNDLVIFDVRYQPEYEVSHLTGAIQVDPKITLDEFEFKYSDLIAGKIVIFYCSVGRRSSNLLHRLNSRSLTAHAKAAYNLSGGIFQWHNRQGTLVDENNRQTSVIHPYNFYWARLISDKLTIQYVPD